MSERTAIANRYRIPSVVRVLFPEGEEKKGYFGHHNSVDPLSNQLLDTQINMTSSQFHQTMPSPSQESEDNYVEGIDGDFSTRLRFWIDKSPGVSTYSIQLCCIFEAGSVINLNELDKTPSKLKEMVLKYESVVKTIGHEGILLPSEVAKLKKLKHASSKKKKEDVVELDGWPTGRSLWDRYMTCRKEIRNKINNHLPETIADTPSGTGLIRAFNVLSHKLYKSESIDLENSDPQSSDVQETIHKVNKYPFVLLLTAKVFYGKAVLSADLAEVQNISPPASKATLKAQQRLMKKERIREKEAALVAKEERHSKKQKRYDSMQANAHKVLPKAKTYGRRNT